VSVLLPTDTRATFKISKAVEAVVLMLPVDCPYSTMANWKPASGFMSSNAAAFVPFT